MFSFGVILFFPLLSYPTLDIIISQDWKFVSSWFKSKFVSIRFACFIFESKILYFFHLFPIDVLFIFFYYHKIITSRDYELISSWFKKKSLMVFVCMLDIWKRSSLFYLFTIDVLFIFFYFVHCYQERVFSSNSNSNSIICLFV